MSSATELLSPVDAAWFRMEDRKDPADIASVMVFDEPLNDARLRAVLEERLLVHRRFKRRVVDSPGRIAPPHWEDEPGFSLDAHFRRVRLEEDSEPALARFVSDLMNEPTDFSRSPWTFCVVDGVGTGSALVVRVHHCMGDGFALVDILLSLADTASGAPRPGPGMAPPGPARDERAHEHEHEGWLASAAHATRDAKDLMTALGHLLVLPFDPPTCFRGKLTGERRVAWSAPVPLSRVKDLAHAKGATVNDVLMTALAGAYRRYMLDRGTEALPFRAIVPVNLRPPGQPIDQEHGNWFGLVFLELPVEVAPPDARLMELKREMDRIKHSKEAVVALGILAVLGRSPVVIDQIAEEVFARKATVVVTNVPGPREPLVLAGSPLRDMWFWAPHPCGLGSGASILSYAGKVRVGIRSDAAIVPDPEVLARHFHAELTSWEP
jgi:diacylglycerol O-acyltransferase / wax synthase